ncbi:endonuclease/exonuclease/phosphatase family protein [Bdellovibrio sp. HCB2-146]|uniref:endonuclease/exonuclease/phosphatase family protein n=1 Tax=Bdellovibrio sp. HCB2-146 TaxID=3394362 RepID=UPI0039BC3148
MLRPFIAKTRMLLVVLGIIVSISITVQAQETCAQNFSFQTHFGTVTEGQHAQGPILYYQADPRLQTPLPKTFRVGTYNILNLYDHAPARVEGAFPAVKERARRQGNARAIEEINPDFQIVVEVENIAALRRFNENYLEHQYEPLLIEGNDSRIDVAILVKRDLPVNFEWRSYKNFKGPNGRPVFSRDLPVGLVYERDSRGQSLEKPKMAILATHYKSQRTDPGDKPTDLVRREQVIATLNIVNELQLRYGNDFPILIAGDFNNSVHNASEFSALFKFGFKDTLDMTEQPIQDRATHYYFPPKGKPPEANQIDAILALAPGLKVLSGKVIADTDANGQKLPPPKTFEERENRPSDHRPIGIEIEL